MVFLYGRAGRQKQPKTAVSGSLKTDDRQGRPPRGRRSGLRSNSWIEQVDSLPGGPVNARDYGAKGDCVHPGTYSAGNCIDCVSCNTDDAPALQRAIDAAQFARRSLYIPAGIYLVNKTLFIRCTGARDMIMDNSPNPMCDGIVNSTHRFFPLRLVGEGMEHTVIMAGAPMRAVLELEAPAIKGSGGGGGEWYSKHNVTGMHSVEHIHFAANHYANNSVFSFGVIRSSFKSLAATGARNFGIWLMDGFILQIEDCKVTHNGMAGIFVVSNDNGIEITNCEPSSNYGPAIIISGGAQVSVHHNVIEGNGGPGVLAVGVEALEISANYFEANCAPAVYKAGAHFPDGFIMVPNPRTAGLSINVNADIVLSGEGFDPNTGRAEYGAGDPNRGVRISSGYHSPYDNGSAVLLIAAIGVVLDGNDNGDHSSPNPTTPLVHSGPEQDATAGGKPGTLWNVTDVSCRGNSAFLAGLVQALPPATHLPAAQQAAFKGCM
jgi:hypothetical protein